MQNAVFSTRLFQLLRLTEDTLEQLIHADAEPCGQFLGRIYLAKVLGALTRRCHTRVAGLLEFIHRPAEK
jgi:hypothetical protein